jgi:uncharacterized Zn finger protein
MFKCRNCGHNIDLHEIINKPLNDISPTPFCVFGDFLMKCKECVYNVS